MPSRGTQRRSAERVRVPRVCEHLACRPLLDQLPGVEHADPLADSGDDPEVVADEQDRRVELRAQLLDQVEHLGLDRGVEPRGRLVQHQQVGIGGERHGEHDPLLLAARELVRVAAQHPRRVRDLHRSSMMPEAAIARLSRAHARWKRNTSAICSPTFIDGLSALPGSW